ncbi:MAG TPA: DUF885 domain-containing protein [Candidatus Baltobacteraceae bacterium]|nr:DUF885 domain-containing protein [Candidatus Baltobacteraceae bacterium]
MSDFEALADAFLDEEFEANPVAASGLGLTAYDARLDDLTASAFEARDAAAVRWLARLDDLPAAELTAAESIDRDLWRAVLRGRVILADWANWRRDPLTYTNPIANGLFGLFLHRLRPEAELAAAAVARLEQAPDALAAGRANLQATLAHPLIVRRALGSARAVSRYVRDLLPTEVRDPADRARLAAAGETAAVALETFAAFLEDLAARATGTWRLGEERYTRLLQDREALVDDARGLRTRGQAEYDRLAAEMRELARRTAGSDDVETLLAAANRVHAPTEEAMRQRYETWTERARTFLRETGLVTLPPGERCLVEPSPVFQRPVLGVASYSSPPAFSESLLGHFFVPFAPDGTPAAEIQQRLKHNNDAEIPSTAVHETYPGHHWHLVMRKSQPSRLRRAYGTPYFTEGWALYAERAMREQGFFDEPIQELFHLNATRFRAARIVVDTSLHLGEMTEEEAITYMVQRAAMPEPTARAEVGRYCAWPTQASAYLTGCLEILRIRDRWLLAHGHTGPARAAPVPLLREFHDALTGSGALPLGLAERALLGG